jgi:hypothetical protein
VYTWLVVLHLVGLLVFVASHGVSGFVAYRLRGEQDRRIIEAMLSISLTATRVAYLGLLLLAVGGLGAAWEADLLLAPWVVGSYVVLAVVLVTMYAIASPYYMAIRKELEPRPGDGQPLSDAELVQRLDSRRPDILLMVGMVGLVVLVWLMSAKPG